MRRLTTEDLKDELNWCLNSSLNFEIKEVNSYWELEKAWKVIIKPEYCGDITFEIHVEQQDNESEFTFEFNEDTWDELNEDNLYQYMFWECLTEINGLNKRLK